MDSGFQSAHIPGALYQVANASRWFVIVDSPKLDASIMSRSCVPAAATSTFEHAVRREPQKNHVPVSEKSRACWASTEAERTVAAQVNERLRPSFRAAVV